MVISLDSKPRRVRRWYRTHVYRIRNFRTLYEQEKETANPQEKKKLGQELQHLQKKVEQHMRYGESLGLNGDKMREFNLAIIEEIKKRKNPQAIIQTLIKENGQK